MQKTIKSIINLLTYKTPSNVEGVELLEDTSEKSEQDNGMMDYNSNPIKPEGFKKPFSTDKWNNRKN